MVSDSITNSPIPSVANTKNLGKKKKTNRSAKLKQNKIDVRREQWLSQGAVKNKGCKDGDGHAPPLPAGKHSKRSLEQLEMRRRRGEVDDRSIHQDSDSESPSNSPTSNDSGTNFTGSGSSSGGSSSSSSSSSSAGCCSGNITEEEEGDDECLDDWEAVADALAADDKRQNPCSDSPPPHDEPVVQTVSPCEETNASILGARNSKPESARMVPCASGNSRAWRADDAFRPQSLPNLSKQLSMPNPNRRCGGRVPWACTSAPSPCPICCEDLDLTDSSFLPCLCGFRLCLFCHKRILEQDGRCPGCRKPYECEPLEKEASVLGSSLTLRLARSASMIERS